MHRLARQMCEIGRRAYARQLVAGTEGNFSCRLDDDRVLCTPTATCKGRLTPADLCVVGLDGRQREGRRRPSSEILMHLGIYRAAPEVRAVIHTHPPFATTLSVLDWPVELHRQDVCAAPPGSVPAPDLGGLLPEGDILLGPVPLIPYRTPGTAEMADPLLPLLADHSAAILQNHGALTWGPDLESAYALTEMLEAVCRVAYQARQVGPVHPIPPAERSKLAEMRACLRTGGPATPDGDAA